MGATNRKAMGWKDTGDGKFSDATDAAKVGDDITSWNIGNTEVPANLPSDYLMLGAYKLLFDGSPQGYTAWMKSPAIMTGRIIRRKTASKSRITS